MSGWILRKDLKCGRWENDNRGVRRKYFKKCVGLIEVFLGGYCFWGGRIVWMGKCFLEVGGEEKEGNIWW